MWQLYDDTRLILDGEVRVYRRELKPLTPPFLQITQRLFFSPVHASAQACARCINVVPKTSQQYR
jgi:hypothetical protein